MRQHQRPPGPTTNDAAPFTSSMLEVSRPDRPVLGKPKSVGWSVAQTTHVAAGFSPEMAQGWHSDSPRLFQKPRIGWSVSQTTHDPAPFSPEMVLADRPNLAQLRKPKPFGWFAPHLTFDVFSIEMVTGWHADRPRVFLAPRIPLPVSQTTHTAATFSIEMVLGARPAVKAMLRKPFGQGWSQTIPDDITSVTPVVDPDYWRGRPWRGHPKIAYPIDGALH